VPCTFSVIELMYKARAQGGVTPALMWHLSRHGDELTSTEIADIRRRLDGRYLVSLYLELPLKIVSALRRSRFTCPVTKFINESAPY